MKACKKDFPIGSRKNQKTDGFYVNDYLSPNLDTLAKAIAKDMMFTLLISGSGWVRVGKSVLAQQLGYYLTDKVNELHGCNNTFTLDNIVFDSADLIDKAFKMEKYSVIILDEGDDLTEAFWTSLSKNLSRFFRKCGQLNLFIILLIPDFFELPRPYAITRSVCLLDVYFTGEFERGQYKFYNFNSKRLLYKKGKKWGDYKAYQPNFIGQFTNFYTVNEAAYRKKKFEDLQVEQRGNTISELDKNILLKKARKDILIKLREMSIDLTIKEKARLFDVGTTTIERYESQLKEEEKRGVIYASQNGEITPKAP